MSVNQRASGLPSYFWLLESADHVKVTEEYVTSRENRILVKNY